MICEDGKICLSLSSIFKDSEGFGGSEVSKRSEVSVGEAGDSVEGIESCEEEKRELP